MRNSDSKIGRAITKLLDENPKVKSNYLSRDFSKNLRFNISKPEDENLGFNKYIVNVQFYSEDRLSMMKLNDPNWITPPGCIGCTILNNKDIFFKNGKVPKKLNIVVSFGMSAASSRNIETKIQYYDINSHKQYEELQYLFPDSEITLYHEFNPTNENTLVKVNDIKVLVNTPRMSAIYAINMINNIYFKEN